MIAATKDSSTCWKFNLDMGDIFWVLNLDTDDAFECHVYMVNSTFPTLFWQKDRKQNFFNLFFQVSWLLCTLYQQILKLDRVPLRCMLTSNQKWICRKICCISSCLLKDNSSPAREEFELRFARLSATKRYKSEQNLKNFC